MAEDLIERIARALYTGRPDTRLLPVEGGAPRATLLHPKRWEDASDSTKEALRDQGREILHGEAKAASYPAVSSAFDEARRVGDDEVVNVLARVLDEIEEQQR